MNYYSLERFNNWKSQVSEYFDYDLIFSYEHLVISAYWCLRGVRWKTSVKNFAFQLHLKCDQLYDELVTLTFVIKTNTIFVIYERGKLRIINSIHIRERVVQKCLCKFCLNPILSRTFIYDNGASQKNKGTTFAIKRVKRLLGEYYRKYGTDGYVIRFDFKSYFDSIPRETAIQLVNEYIEDEQVLNLVRRMVYINSDNHGLNLGSEVSQTLAVFYTTKICHYLKDKLRLRYYVQYMDDGWILVRTKEEAVAIIAAIDEISQQWGLKLNKKKTFYLALKRGFTFLQKRFLLKDTGKIVVRISRSSVTRMYKKMKWWFERETAGLAEHKQVEQYYKSTIGNIKKYDTCKLRRNLRLMWKEHYGYEPPRVGKNAKKLDNVGSTNPIHQKFENSIIAKRKKAT